MTRLLAVSLCLVARGSSTPAPSTTAPPPAPVTTTARPSLGGHVVDGLFVPDGYAADPRTCATDDECTCNSQPAAGTPCCQDPSTLRCYRQDYWEALSLARNGACTGITCPPPPPPMPPPECALTGRCIAGRCGDACQAPPPPTSAPPPS